MATHSSIPAWRIPWTEKLGGLQSTGRKESDTTERLHFHLDTSLGGFPGGVSGRNPPANAGDKRDMGLIPGFGRSPGEGNGNPLQDSCLENSVDRGVWWATVHGSKRVDHD